MFVLKSDITIGKFRFTGVHEVRIERSMHTWEERAYIQVPSRARVIRNGKATAQTVTTANLFAEGDAVTVNLGYNDNMNTEFRGFVKRRNLGMPLEVECEGYAYKLRKQAIKSANLTAGIDVHNLLQLATAGTGITYECPVSFKMYGRTLTNTNSIKLLEEIKKVSDGALTVFFLEPDKLWVGLAYTPFLAGTDTYNLPRVGYRLGYNCIKDNALKQRIPNEQIQVIINGMLASGDTVRTASDEKKDARKVQHLMNGVKDSGALKLFAQEKADQANYTGYEGTLTAFLEPFVAPGYTATITDDRYPERTGRYVVESVTTIFGINGARRRVELGPRVGTTI